MSEITKQQFEYIKLAITRLIHNDSFERIEYFIFEHPEFKIDLIKKYFKQLFDCDDNRCDVINKINFANVTIDDVLANPEIEWNFYDLSTNKNFTLDIILKHKEFKWNFYNYFSENKNASWQDIVNNPDICCRLPLFIKGPIPNDYELLKKFDKLHLYIEYVDDVAKFLNDHKFNHDQLLEIVNSPNITIDVSEIIKTNLLFEEERKFFICKYNNMTFEELLKTPNPEFWEYGNKVTFPFSAIKEHPEFFKDNFKYKSIDDYFTYSSNKGLTWDVIVNNKHLPWSYTEYIKTHDDYDIDFLLQNMNMLIDNDVYTILKILIEKLTRDQLIELLEYLLSI